MARHRPPKIRAMTELAKSFEPAAIEAHWGPLWEAERRLRADARPGASPRSAIQLPPPNVTGTLHMGHAFHQTIMDALTRYHRMRGFNTLWVPGTDHAGIATQIVVERQLQDAGHSPPRPRPREVRRRGSGTGRSESGSTITRQMRRLGDSVELVARVLHDGRAALGASSPRPSCGSTRRA